MAIILEGFDNAGKSTLAATFGLEVEHPGPAPKDRMSEYKCMEQQQRFARLPVVMDRVTCVSSQVYGNRLFDEYLTQALRAMVSTPHCIIIYCRPNLDKILDFKGHKAKGYDTPQRIRWLEKNALRLVSQYDQLMRSIPSMKYDWVNPDPGVVQAAFDAQFTLGAWKKCQENMKLCSQG